MVDVISFVVSRAMVVRSPVVFMTTDVSSSVVVGASAGVVVSGVVTAGVVVVGVTVVVSVVVEDVVGDSAKK